MKLEKTRKKYTELKLSYKIENDEINIVLDYLNDDNLLDQKLFVFFKSGIKKLKTVFAYTNELSKNLNILLLSKGKNETGIYSLNSFFPTLFHWFINKDLTKIIHQTEQEFETMLKPINKANYPFSFL